MFGYSANIHVLLFPCKYSMNKENMLQHNRILSVDTLQYLTQVQLSTIFVYEILEPLVKRYIQIG